MVNPDAPFGHVKGQHLVRRVNRQGFVKVDLYPYYLSSKLAGQKVTLSIQPKEQELQVVYPHEYRRSLPLKGLLVNSANVRRFLRRMVGNRRETWESTLQTSVKWLEKRVTVRHFW